MSTTRLMTFSDEEDFGFTFSDQTDHQKQTDEVAEKLQSMYDAIIPLLKNLSKNPNQDYIKWPNRIEKIGEFKQKLDSIGGEHIKVKKL